MRSIVRQVRMLVRVLFEIEQARGSRVAAVSWRSRALWVHRILPVVLPPRRSLQYLLQQMIILSSSSSWNSTGFQYKNDQCSRELNGGGTSLWSPTIRAVDDNGTSTRGLAILPADVMAAQMSRLSIGGTPG